MFTLFTFVVYCFLQLVPFICSSYFTSPSNFVRVSYVKHYTIVSQDFVPRHGHKVPWLHVYIADGRLRGTAQYLLYFGTTGACNSTILIAFGDHENSIRCTIITTTAVFPRGSQKRKSSNNDEMLAPVS